MNKTIVTALLTFNMIFFSACMTQNDFIFVPAPGSFNNKQDNNLILFENITATKNGHGYENIPEWLMVYIQSGTEELENMYLFTDKYCFIDVKEGSNFEALNIWMNNYSLALDFQKLAAGRIENRLFSMATLYPDDEYGLFYEKLVKKAFVTEYPQAVLEDIFWIRKKQADGSGEVYVFFVFTNIYKKILQTVINNMMEEVHASVTPTRSQNNAIRRLQQNFFEGF